MAVVNLLMLVGLIALLVGAFWLGRKSVKKEK